MIPALKKTARFYLVLFIFPLYLQCQINPPCNNTYGSSSDEQNIVQQMRYGSITEAVEAINQAKNTRGTTLGCPEESLSYAVTSCDKPSLTEVSNIWTTIHSPQISNYTISCPRIGRYENNSALGAYYAMQAGFYSDTNQLVNISNMM